MLPRLLRFLMKAGKTVLSLLAPIQQAVAGIPRTDPPQPLEAEMLVISLFLAIFAQQNLELVREPGFVRRAQEYFALDDNVLHLSLYRKIVTWNIESGKLIQTRPLPFRGHFYIIGVHGSELLAVAYNSKDNQFSIRVFGENQTVVTEGVYFSKFFSLNDTLFVSPAKFDVLYLSANPFPFTLVEATLEAGKIAKREDALFLAKLSQKNRTIQYNVKSTLFSGFDGGIVGMNALEPKLITYTRANILKENVDGTKTETNLPGLNLVLPEWQAPPSHTWMKGFDPTKIEASEARARWHCDFNIIQGLSTTNDFLAVCYTTARFASYEDGECIGKKTGIAVFRRGESNPIAHRWLVDGLLVGTHDNGFLLFWPNQNDNGDIHPTVEIWRP